MICWGGRRQAFFNEIVKRCKNKTKNYLQNNIVDQVGGGRENESHYY